MARQLGFRIQLGRCVQCHACEVACKVTNSVELGPKWRKVQSHWNGLFPNVTNIAISKSCMHCAKPACIQTCPTQAITKHAENGIVVVDQAKCIGCRRCAKACPYESPQYGKTGKMQKCDLCSSRLQQGKVPACVSTCPGDALQFGDLETLAKESAQPASKLEGRTQPSFVLVPAFHDIKVEAYISAFFPV